MLADSAFSSDAILRQEGHRFRRRRFHSFVFHFVEKVPIPAVPPEKQKPVVRLVDRILARNGPISALEREIDERVYRLYGLSPDEIKLVEESMAR